MSLEPYQERQDYEFQALQSIFEDDLIDLRKKAWKVSGPLELQLTLKPQESNGGGDRAYVQLDMIIKCAPNYPDVAPDIDLINPKGVSDQLVKELRARLGKQASELIGEVMIWDLANTVQGFLYKHNRPPEQSFHEQMLKNKKQQLEKRIETQRKIEEEERLEMERIVQQRQAALRSEKQRRRDENRAADWSTPVAPSGIFSKQPSFSPSTSPIIIGSPPALYRQSDSTQAKPHSPTTPVAIPMSRRRRKTSTPKQSEEEDWCGSSPSKDSAPGITSVTFTCNKIERKVNRGRCLGHSNSGSTVYAAMDLSTGDMVAIAEWVMRWRRVGKRSTIEKDEDQEGLAHMKQVSVIEQEMSSLLKLKHPNLIHYMAMHHQYDSGKITVNLLMEYSGGVNLSIYTHHKGPLSLEALQAYTIELLEALRYLHGNSIVHRDLRASSVFIDSLGKVRLAGYSIDKRLADLYATVDKARPGVHFSDPKPMVIGRGGQKGDIYQLGLMLLSLILGKTLSESIPDIPSALPASVHDFMHKCLQTDERLRWTASQLLEHSFIKTPLPPLLTVQDDLLDKKNKQDESDNQKDDSEDKKDEEPLEYLMSLLASGQSRLTSEFELLKVLGKGGFGDVLKVKNKLDGRFYAIKRIPLNPKSKMFNKKMKREVKLLSRLNHENVVRYYCSWIEVSDDPAQSDSSSTWTSSSQAAEQVPVSKKAPHIVKSYALTKDPLLAAGLKSANSSLDPLRDIENLVPSAGDESEEWLTSMDQGDAASESSSDEEEDCADVFGTSLILKMNDSEEEHVVFGMGEDNANTTESPEESSQCDNPNNTPKFENLVMKLLYIQMEYCEKSTLRNCIDDGLCIDMVRVWRLFREIIEGLIHIHGQGVIHRDLKPVNIFLDSNDNVKIGDFGLATTDILVKQGGIADLTLPSPLDVSTTSGSSSNDGNLTGKVGTALYVSPEVMQGGSKVHYDQKVDIYSLGIIFFEMCYHALPTGMERVKILNNLRQAATLFPEDFQGDHLDNPTKLIKWLLLHDPSKRPSAKELLLSELLPPPVMQENELNELIVSTINNPQSSSYRKMLNVIFGQPITFLTEITYDQDLHENPISSKIAMINKKVEEILVEVFSSHGAVCVPTPLFMPKLGLYESNEQCVMLMDQRGGIVMVPMDHRVPFARYIGRTNIQHMKRYTFGKAYREKGPHNIHPREMTECAFDIITTSPSLIPDAEVLTVIQEIINEFPSLGAKNYFVCLNHMSLLKAVFLYCGIPENQHFKAMTILAENMANKQKRMSLLDSELKLKMSDQMTSQLNSLLDLQLEIVKGEFGRVNSHFKSITKAGGQASTLARSGLHDLELIVSYAQCLGLELTVMLSLNLIYNPNQYSGVVYQIVCDVKKKKRTITEVLAAGGSYDKLIEKFYSPLYKGGSGLCRHGVGISIAFERLVAVVSDDKQMKSLSHCDVVVCSIGRQLMITEKLNIARTLREAGFRTELLAENTDNLDDLQESCRNAGIHHIIIFKDGDASLVKVLSLNQEHTTDKTVPCHRIVENLQSSIPEKANENISCLTQRALAKENTANGDMVFNVASNISSNANIAFKFSITFIAQDKGSRNPYWVKRRHEALIAGKVPTLYPWLPEKNVEVLALDMSISDIKIIQAEIEIGDVERYEASKKVILDKSLKQQRKYLTSVFDVMDDRINDKNCNYILLYSMKDEKLRLIT